MCEQASHREMPPWYYVSLHPSATLTQNDVNALCTARTSGDAVPLASNFGHPRPMLHFNATTPPLVTTATVAVLMWCDSTDDRQPSKRYCRIRLDCVCFAGVCSTASPRPPPRA
jgi:hypothetical protein